jgi:hypothetical protein
LWIHHKGIVFLMVASQGNSFPMSTSPGNTLFSESLKKQYIYIIFLFPLMVYIKKKILDCMYKKLVYKFYSFGVSSTPGWSYAQR